MSKLGSYLAIWPRAISVVRKPEGCKPKNESELEINWLCLREKRNRAVARRQKSIQRGLLALIVCVCVCVCTRMCGCSVISVISTSLPPYGPQSPGSSVHGISEAGILEWVAISFSKGSSQPRDWTQVSHMAGGSVMSEPPGKPNESKTPY